jgi:glutamyl-tRNA synthetase/nondiscriminating glutamyl-tRNA synthetase
MGNARTALFAYLFAKHNNGRFILRIEDTDQERLVEGSEKQFLEDLKWLGLDWDEGPDVGGPLGPYRCSERYSIYEDQLKKIRKLTRVYRCFCSPDQLDQDRKLLQSQKKIIKYVGRCKAISEEESQKRADAKESFVWRLEVKEDGPPVIIQDSIRGEVKFERKVIGDFILFRSNGVPVFLFANAVDDALQEMTHVIRGEDHLSNTFRQVIILEHLGHKIPTFAHLPMIGAEGGGKLSKREGSLAIKDLREEGFLPQGLVNYLALLGWSPGDTSETGEKFSKDKLIELFDLSRVQKARALFDMTKFKFLNYEHMKDLSIDDLIKRAPVRDEALADKWKAAVELIRHDVSTTNELYKVEAYFKSPDFEGSDPAKSVLNNEAAINAIQFGQTKFKELCAEESVGDALKKSIKLAGKEYSLKGKQLFFPFRVALTAMDSGPELVPLAEILGKEEVEARLGAAAEFGKSLIKKAV